MTHPVATLLLDASCLLNLYATRRFRDITLALPYQLAVADYVLEEEALYVWRPDATGIQEEPDPVDLSSLVDEGLMQVMGLVSPDEEATFVELAARVDDGEAITGALAAHRQCSLATDDRKARRVLGERLPAVPLLSTLELLRVWADSAAVPDADLRQAMDGMRLGASYVPGPRDPLYSWWWNIMEGGSSAPSSTEM